MFPITFVEFTSKTVCTARGFGVGPKNIRIYIYIYAFNSLGCAFYVSSWLKRALTEVCRSDRLELSMVRRSVRAQ